MELTTEQNVQEVSARDMAQLVACLFGKDEPLSSIPSLKLSIFISFRR